MKNFPVENVKTEAIRFYCYRSLPKFDWGKKLYIYAENTLWAAIPLYSYLAKERDSFYSFVGFNVAGKGVQNFQYTIDAKNKVHSSIKVFAKPEDYERFVSGDASAEFIPDHIVLADLVRVHGMPIREESVGDGSQVIGWRFRDGIPVEVPIWFKDVWVDGDGAHITFLRKGMWNDCKYYLTREECIAANRPSIIEFDEDVQAPEQREYTIPVSLTILATSAKEARAKAIEICGSSLTVD